MNINDGDDVLILDMPQPRASLPLCVIQSTNGSNAMPCAQTESETGWRTAATAGPALSTTHQHEINVDCMICWHLAVAPVWSAPRLTAV